MSLWEKVNRPPYIRDGLRPIEIAQPLPNGFEVTFRGEVVFRQYGRLTIMHRLQMCSPRFFNIDEAIELRVESLRSIILKQSSLKEPNAMMVSERNIFLIEGKLVFFKAKT